MSKNINNNDRFGYWVVLEQAPSHISPSGTSRKMYKCKCDCGTIRNVAATQLRNNKTTSCGCKGAFLKPNEKYQEWTVLEKATETNSHGSQFYTCQCSCGVIRNVRMSDLTNGNSKNCGHSRYKLS